MPVKYSIGFKLSQRARNDLANWFRTKGKQVLETGWDYVIVDTALTPVEKAQLITDLIRNLLKEELV